MSGVATRVSAEITSQTIEVRHADVGAWCAMSVKNVITKSMLLCLALLLLLVVVATTTRTTHTHTGSNFVVPFAMCQAGFRCPRARVIQHGSESGCCETSTTTGIPQFSCAGCTLAFNCCTTFEACVSCCLDPVHVRRVIGLSTLAQQLACSDSTQCSALATAPAP